MMHTLIVSVYLIGGLFALRWHLTYRLPTHLRVMMLITVGWAIAGLADELLTL